MLDNQGLTLQKSQINTVVFIFLCHVCQYLYFFVFRYALGVYNSKTEVMKIYDTEMITLQPKVIGKLCLC